jgi:cell division protein FtsL
MKAVWLPIVVVGCVVLMGAYLYPVLKMDYAGQREVERLQAQLESLQERNADLRHEVDRLKTPEGVEQAARETLGYVKPGENAYVVLDGDEEEQPQGAVMPAAEAALAEEPPPWWQRILDRLFGVDS